MTKSSKIATAVVQSNVSTESTKPAGLAEKYNMSTLYTEHKNTSGVMRFLISQGHKDGEIARFLGKIPQHVNNVRKQPLKKPATVETATTDEA